MKGTNVSTPIAIVTGASRGLGKSTALKLAERGVDAILTYRGSAEEAKNVTRQFEIEFLDAGVEAYAFTFG